MSDTKEYIKKGIKPWLMATGVFSALTLFLLAISFAAPPVLAAAAVTGIMAASCLGMAVVSEGFGTIFNWFKERSRSSFDRFSEQASKVLKSTKGLLTKKDEGRIKEAVSEAAVQAAGDQLIGSAGKMGNSTGDVANAALIVARSLNFPEPPVPTLAPPIPLPNPHEVDVHNEAYYTVNSSVAYIAAGFPAAIATLNASNGAPFATIIKDNGGLLNVKDGTDLVEQLRAIATTTPPPTAANINKELFSSFTVPSPSYLRTTTQHAALTAVAVGTAPVSPGTAALAFGAPHSACSSIYGVEFGRVAFGHSNEIVIMK